MKKTITILSLLIVTFTKAQMVTADFESFTLTPNSFYLDSINSTDFQTTNAIFEYTWDKKFGGFWSAGYAYTNKNDSVDGSYNNLYGCKALKGYANSSKYVTGQAGGAIKLKAPSNYVNGFYVTNTTYSHKIMQIGDTAFHIAKKFGGVSGNDPDWCKIIVKGYLGGVAKPDSSTFYLADYRFANNNLDYIVKNWQWVDCSNLGNVDSIKIFMKSSDVGAFGMNNPAFFCIDNFTTSQGVGIHELSFFDNVQLYPNPVSSKLNVQSSKFNSEITTLKIFNAIGSVIKNFELNSENSEFDLSDLNSGMYFAELSNKEQKRTYKIIKN